MSVRENLIKAKALIDAPEKWGKGGYEDFNVTAGVTCRCATGALAAAFGVEPMPMTCEVGKEYDALKAALSDGFRTVVDFNDHPDTNHSDIMALFDRAIASAE